MSLAKRSVHCLTFSLTALLAAATRAEQPPAQPGVGVEVQTVGKLADGTTIDQYTLANRQGVTITVLTHGATITGVMVPDRHGKVDNVTLHLDQPLDYLKGHPLFGSIVGRYANRIANASFAIDGKQFHLTQNAGKNHIHGGNEGFQQLVWSASPIVQSDRAGIELTHTSPDGHAGYPGTLTVKLHYLLTNDNQLVLEYWATSDKPTHVNLTNHAYWNLGGIRSGSVLQHLMMINAEQYLEADPQRFPSGTLLSVENTPMDFRTPHTIGSRIEQLASKNYDDCYVLSKRSDQGPSLAARVEEPASGRVMEVFTTAPGVQFYTARGLDGRVGAKGISYGPYHGFCLETQHFPDSPNKPQFPPTLLRPGETYHQVTVYRFSVLN